MLNDLERTTLNNRRQTIRFTQILHDDNDTWLY